MSQALLWDPYMGRRGWISASWNCLKLRSPMNEAEEPQLRRLFRKGALNAGLRSYPSAIV